MVTITPIPGYAQTNLQWQSDTTTLDVRLPPAEKLASYKADNTFKYTREEPNQDSFLTRIFQWFSAWLSDFIDNETTVTILEILAYLLFIAMIIVLINQYLKGNLKAMITGDHSATPLEISPENGSRDNLDPLIEQAVSEHRYADAICQMYRKLLYDLAAKNYINWKKDKTNHDYTYELSSNKMRALFKDVTHYYEYAEYGSFPIDKKRFDTVRSHFNRIHTLIEE